MNRLNPPENVLARNRQRVLWSSYLNPFRDSSLAGLTLLVLAILFSLFEVTVLRFFSFRNIKPDLLLILVIYIGLNSPAMNAGLYSCIIGLVGDCFSLGYFGANTLSLGSLGFSLGFINKYFYKDNAGFNILVLFLSVAVYYIIYYLILGAFYIDLIFLKSLVFIILPSILYTLLVAPLLLPALKRMLPPIPKRPQRIYY